MPKYFNTTFSPLVWNDKGQIIGGGEWLTVDEVTPEIEALLARNEMVLVEEQEQPKPTRTRRSKTKEETQE
jgi:hypothetical protein